MIYIKYIKGDGNFILNERFRISVELKNRKSLTYYLKEENVEIQVEILKEPVSTSNLESEINNLLKMKSTDEFIRSIFN